MGERYLWGTQAQESEKVLATRMTGTCNEWEHPKLGDPSRGRSRMVGEYSSLCRTTRASGDSGAGVVNRQEQVSPVGPIRLIGMRTTQQSPTIKPAPFRATPQNNAARHSGLLVDSTGCAKNSVGSAVSCNVPDL
ncbi:hypothetical protein ACRALDRAFT_209715 [Sodiomyces alcalophilus JCM 7366]|uniref:uncharacterized protein n=1 Tax=Sodiomyces alcalophilus JCM 7366 TaxID=591952 RepID=UPI0039B49020